MVAWLSALPCRAYLLYFTKQLEYWLIYFWEIAGFQDISSSSPAEGGEAIWVGTGTTSAGEDLKPFATTTIGQMLGSESQAFWIFWYSINVDGFLLTLPRNFRKLLGIYSRRQTWEAMQSCWDHEPLHLEQLLINLVHVANLYLS